MIVNIRDQLKKTTPYVDRPNSWSENIGEVLGIFVLILFIGSMLYLLLGGLPTIQTGFMLFLQMIGKIFS